MTIAPLRLGISRCLLGEGVRFDGGHKRDAFLTDLLGRYVEWVPVCPEVEAGLGTPREAMRLVGDPDGPRLMTIKSGQDHTPAIEAMAKSRLLELDRLDLSGYVFKKDSPSCGIERVRLYNKHGMPNRKGVGLFAMAFMKRFPLTPVEEEGRLCDPILRENFIERVFCYRRWRDLVQGGATRQAVVRFHTIHKYLLLAHSVRHYQTLGRLVAQANQHRPHELASRYGELFMQALAVKATVRKHVNVLQHILGHFKDRLTVQEKQELLGVIADYHQGLTPLIVPLTLIKHYVQVFDVEYVHDQVYLNPHPKELMLRNHV
ncbi:MAG: hypothetical protein NBKEAIPA_00928 [Nitrospirae bacterium]|nr:hypothetical protein [Nitrospirota bacterium]MCK6494559.1 DUF523 and DUF1722 domain-containing protein [Nitrospira sp.]MEB2338122.1 DUF523 and DUF1722 domain-containing protein [Nitrospirales bacterium]QOJ35323.1 MAG: DUF523 and DUF1722 domain-containing protein [Nitrospira sp.]